MTDQQERTQYASSILVSQKPVEATEIVRVRLSQAKLLNDEFSTFFQKYYDIKAQYLQQLNTLVQHSQDLNKNIEKSIIANNVLSPEELQHYNIDAIGHLSEIWNKVIAEIKDEISANNQLKNVVEGEVIKPLTQYTTKNRQWSEIRNLHSKLSDVAKNIEMSQDKIDKYADNSRHQDKLDKYQTQLNSANATWDSEAPYVFEVFEHTDYGRLTFLRDSLLRFITAYTDSLNKISSSNEETLNTILGFDPEVEIARFAKVSSETTYVPKAARQAAESPVKLSMNAVPESETSSLSDSVRAPNRRASRTSSYLSLGNNHSVSNLGAHTSPTKDPSPLSQPQQQKNTISDVPPAVPQKYPSGINTPMSLNQAPLQPISRGSSSNNFNNTNGATANGGIREQQSMNSFSEVSSHINSDTQSPVDSTFQPALQQPVTTEPQYQQPAQDQYPSTLAPQQQQSTRAPPPPPSRKTGTLTNISEDQTYSFEQPSSINHTVSHGQVPQPPTNRRDIQSGLFTNLSQSDLENHQSKRISSFNSFAGSTSQLRPQMTGSSIGTTGGLFQHPQMSQPGLNASVAEVVHAKFKDGEQVQGSIIGEIAFNYYSEDVTVPTRTNVKIAGAEAFDQKIANTQFFKEIDTDEFELTPQPILGRTLGGLKFSIKDAKAPIVIIPAWRFEPHQSSVMLTLKLAPHVLEALPIGQSVILDDLIVAVSIKGASKSALSKPQGTFSKDKSRITWRFKEPVTLNAQSDQKLVARFMTDVQGEESDSGVLVKFTVNSDSGASTVTSPLELAAQDYSDDDPFAQAEWRRVPTVKTLVAGSYSGLS
ncbi:Suppressor of profilin [Cyberlindnera fabianii]|uniref:Suppressor of profilin n=1 Tax=Cyberlindnera fabianii TaxID=36022 RepID=A0A1V2LB41_CYBFA|nr:Suppressor of profilin [Cyberlindnera fabianii]